MYPNAKTQELKKTWSPMRARKGKTYTVTNLGKKKEEVQFYEHISFKFQSR